MVPKQSINNRSRKPVMWPSMTGYVLRPPTTLSFLCSSSRRKNLAMDIKIRVCYFMSFYQADITTYPAYSIQARIRKDESDAACMQRWAVYADQTIDTRASEACLSRRCICCYFLLVFIRRRWLQKGSSRSFLSLQIPSTNEWFPFRLSIRFALGSND